uniref:Ankyrin repeat-containing protein n=1 Tax=Borely moumouvirus TaxID=2712067 RepID=A0A6G6AD42_9VIRU
MSKIVKKYPIGKKDERSLVRLIISGKKDLDTYQKIKVCLENDKNQVNCVDENGWSPLILACTACWSSIEIIKLLIEFGADVNYCNNDESVLMKSLMLKPNNSKNNNIQIIKLLIESGVDLNMQNIYGWTALMLVCKYSDINNNIDIVKLLIESGANLNIQNIYIMSALAIACEFINTTSNIETIKVLLAACNNNLKENALLISACHNNIEAIKLLLENDVDINCRNIDGKTPLIFASMSSKLEAVKLLLELGADPNIQEKNNATALIYTCQISMNLEIIKLLLHYNTNPSLKDYMGRSALYYASGGIVKDKDIEAFLFLLNYSSESDYVSENENIFINLPNKYFLKCLKIINEIAYQKMAMKYIHKQIKYVSNKLLYNPDSIRSRLIILKLTSENNPIKNCITWDNLQLFDYLGLYDLDSISDKVSDALKYLD